MSSSYRDTSPAAPAPTLMTGIYPHHPFKDPVSKYAHIPMWSENSNVWTEGGGVHDSVPNI